MRRRRTAHRFGEKRRTTDVLIDEKVDFSGLMLSSDVLKGLNSSGFERPSPIQLKAIPLGRCGLDLIAQAKSGTGKTCVFSVIALENINWAVSSVQVLVLAPTREIAVQIKDVMCSIGQHLKGLQTHVFIGGMSLEDDKSHLKQCHIAIGTPGRIKHLIESKLLQTSSIRLFILDEADKLLEENFEAQTNWIFSTLPASKQMLALSATYPDHLAEQLKNYMKDPTFVRLNAADPSLEGIRHYRCVVPTHSLPHKVFHEKVQSLLQLLTKLSFHQCLIFSNYQIRARNLSETLSKNGWPSTYISGNQGQNERLNAMAKLKEFKCRILISTDLTSRGIDAERVNLVINMDLPHDSETYLHRVGRAGRFGSYGAAVNFVAEGKEVNSLEEIQNNCGVTITSLPDDVSKLLEDEMMEATHKNSEKHEVKSFNEVEHNKTDHKNINKQDAGNIQHAGKANSDSLEVDCQMIENKIVKTEEALNNQELHMVDKGKYNKEEESKKIDIQHEEMKNEMKEARMAGDKQQTITVVGDNVNIQYQHSKSRMKEIKQETNKEIKVEQEELKDEIQSNEETRNIQGIVANGEAEFLYHEQNDAEGNENSEDEYQEKQCKIENTQEDARDIELARILKESVIDIVESKENGSLMKNNELEGKVQLEDVAAEETFVVETQETEHQEIDSVEVFQVGRGVDKINNVDDANRQDMVVDNDNVKSEEADCKMVDTEKASKIPQASMVFQKNFGVNPQTTDRKPKNIFSERIISQEGIVSRVNGKVDYEKKKNGNDNAGTLFGMSDLASEHEMVSEEKNEFTKGLTGKSNPRDCITNQNGEGRIIFQTHDQNAQHSDEDDNVDDFLIFLSDDEYELSSLEKTESLDSSEESHDSHVPISCKDFENDFEAYLKIAVCSSNDESFQDNEPCTSHTSRQSLKSTIPEQAGGGNPVCCASDNAIYANDSVPSGTSSNTRVQSSYVFGQLSRSQIRKDVNYSKPVIAEGNGISANEFLSSGTSSNARAQSHSFGQPSKSAIRKDANYSKPAAAQGNVIYANTLRSDEPNGRFSTNENNHEPHAGEAMFYGATPYDVTAYMAGLPAEWKRTWYRVYDKQTKFIMNYTKYCHEKF